MGTVHFVYPRDLQRHSSPWCIGNEIGNRLLARYPVKFYHWRDDVCIQPEPGDVLLGHPHWSARSVFRRSVTQPGFARRLLLAPYAGDARQVAFHDSLMDHCDLFLAITGGYWFTRVAQTPMARWAPKMRHIDLAVNRDHFPTLKTAFNPRGQRRFVYIGHTAKNKNTPYLAAIAKAWPEGKLAWIGQGRKPIPGLAALGRQDFRSPDGQALIASFDFTLTVGATDANPTTILETLGWGLIPVCTMQSGYEGVPGIVNVPLGDVPGAVAVLQRLQDCDEADLLQLRQQGESAMRTHFHWDRVYAQVEEAIHGNESPPLRRATWREALALRMHSVFH